MSRNLEVKDFDIRTFKLPTGSILNRFEYINIDLDEFHKSDIIESILLRIPLKRICIHDDSNSEQVFIGSDIIQTIEEFYSNSFKLTTDIIDLNGVFYYKDLPRSIQRCIDQNYIEFVVLNTWNTELDYRLIKNKIKKSN